MSKFIVIHHAHHADEGEEGIYRLVYAVAEDVVEMVEVPNPDYDHSKDTGRHEATTQEPSGLPDLPPIELPVKDEVVRMPMPDDDPTTDAEYEDVHFLTHGEPPESRDYEWDEHDPTTNNPTKMVEAKQTIFHSYREIIWHAGDPRWKDRPQEEIAAEQRAIVKDVITKRIAEEEKAFAIQEQARTDLGSIGTEL